MPDHYRIFGAELSPYSVKVRSYCRYKGIPHQWQLRNAAAQAEYEKYAKIPIIPLVVTPEDTGIQDSTPIIEYLESLYPEPSIHPNDPINEAPLLSAQEAEEWGLVNRVVPDTDLLAEAEKLAGQLAKGPTGAFGGAKRLLQSGWTETLETQMENETQSIAARSKTEDGREGITAFLEKRAPQFTGGR